MTIPLVRFFRPPPDLRDPMPAAKTALGREAVMTTLRSPGESPPRHGPGGYGAQIRREAKRDTGR